MSVEEILEESGKWRSREVSYVSGNWKQLKEHIPKFRLDDFGKSEGEGDNGGKNRFYRVVTRLPKNQIEREIPIGLVSNSYHLAQHREVGELCINALQTADIKTSELKIEVGLSELGEWMNLRIYFPEKYNHKPSDGETIQLRLECFNSVDGSTRLIVMLGWYRFVCSNGLIIGDTITELRDIHNQGMDLLRIPKMISNSLSKVKADKDQLDRWSKQTVERVALKNWINSTVASKWGKKAACRAYHICISGHDVVLLDPFEGGFPSDKKVTKRKPVAGSEKGAQDGYAVSQILSWLASHRNNVESRTERQRQIPELINSLLEA